MKKIVNNKSIQGGAYKNNFYRTKVSKIKEYLGDPKSMIIYLMNKNCFWFLSDKKYLKFKFKIVFNKKLNLDNPKTFNEKLQWLKLYDRNPEYTKMVDKGEVKKYIASIIGEEYIIPTLGVYKKFEDIDFNKLPNSFVMKCVHDSGGLVICKDKSNFNVKNAKKEINKYLKRNYYSVHREWPYKNVEHQIIVEKYLDQNLKENKKNIVKSGKTALVDYRFYCFNGKVKLVYQYVNEEQSDGSKPEPNCCNIYDENWNLLPFRQAYPPSKKKYDKPERLEKMIELAEKISANIPFIRVDFYYVNGEIYFGELTFFPGAGFSKFFPDEYDLKIGEYLKLPEK